MNRNAIEDADIFAGTGTVWSRTTTRVIISSEDTQQLSGDESDRKGHTELETEYNALLLAPNGLDLPSSHAPILLSSDFEDDFCHCIEENQQRECGDL